MAHRIPSAVSMDECMAFIVAMAKRADGVSLAEVAEFCELTQSAARARIAFAVERHPQLTRAERELGFRKRDVRWFLDPAHANDFENGRSPDCAGGRAQVTTVDLPMDRLPAVYRPGALDFQAHGSRRGNWIYFRDGSRTPVDSNNPPK